MSRAGFLESSLLTMETRVMREFLFLGICGICLLARSMDAAALDVRLTYKGEGDFARLSEFLDGKENTGGVAIVRSQPAHRAGLYFSMIAEDRVGQLPAGGKVSLEVVYPDMPKVKTFSLLLPRVPARAREMLVGLTGEDWPGAGHRPVAWRVRILDGKGKVIASEQSFLWEGALPSPEPAP